MALEFLHHLFLQVQYSEVCIQKSVVNLVAVWTYNCVGSCTVRDYSTVKLNIFWGIAFGNRRLNL